MRMLIALWIAFFNVSGAADELLSARDRQDRDALGRKVAELAAIAERQPDDAAVQYRLALAGSYLSEVALELRDKEGAKGAAESGIAAARKAVALKGDSAEYHRVLGTLCGQVIPANPLAGFKYGRCALDGINKAVELDPKSSSVWMSRGVGNYYLPPAFGGGVELAIEDFRKAIELNPKSVDAHLWLGIALRKANRNADARQALAKAVELNPQRIWAKQQLEKTPAQ